MLDIMQKISQGVKPRHSLKNVRIFGVPEAIASVDMARWFHAFLSYVFLQQTFINPHFF